MFFFSLWEDCKAQQRIPMGSLPSTTTSTYGNVARRNNGQLFLAMNYGLSLAKRVMEFVEGLFVMYFAVVIIAEHMAENLVKSLAEDLRKTMGLLFVMRLAGMFLVINYGLLTMIFVMHVVEGLFAMHFAGEFAEHLEENWVMALLLADDGYAM